jgi:hypothetical protein
MWEFFFIYLNLNFRFKIHHTLFYYFLLCNEIKFILYIKKIFIFRYKIFFKSTKFLAISINSIDIFY